MGKSSPRGREGGHTLHQHRQSCPRDGRGSLGLETIQGQRELQPFREKVWGPQAALGCSRDPYPGHLSPLSLLSLRTPATCVPTAPRGLKVHWVELWSWIQVMTDFSSSGVTALPVPLALSLSILPMETQERQASWKSLSRACAPRLGRAANPNSARGPGLRFSTVSFLMTPIQSRHSSASDLPERNQTRLWE